MDMVVKLVDYKFKNLRVFFVWFKIYDNLVYLILVIININF